jgi:DNA mismatch endonuclease (patch repair protein)
MMANDLSPKERDHRSWLMSRVRGKDTKPELVVRKIAWSLGARYRLHVKRLPGRPDLVFASRRKAIFVNGCFWHRHQGCRLSTTPKTNTSFWNEKFKANVARDRRNIAELEAAGWSVLTIWQCETKDLPELHKRLSEFLGIPNKPKWRPCRGLEDNKSR